MYVEFPDFSCLVADSLQKSTLVDFLAILRDVFAKEPPVIARQTAARPPSTAPSATPTPPPLPPLPQELAARSRPASVVQQAPAPPPKSTATVAAIPAATVAARTSPSPPPVPPHPHSSSRQSLAGALHDSRFGPAAASTASSPSPPPPPPVPGRPAYQQSPLGQPPLQPQPQQLQQQLQQQQAYLPQQPQPQYNPPYRPDLPPQQPPLPQQQQPAYFQYPPPQQQQQQQPPPPWAQQQQPPPPLRTKAPPPPDIMDEDDAKGVDGAASGGAGSSAAPPPPVPPNPEKDALLRELARVLAEARQRGRGQDAATLAGLQAQRTAMLAAAQQIQKDMSDVGQLSALLTANTAMLHETLSAADSVVARGQQTRPPAIDELLVGPTVVAAQLYDLVAEERALADAVFMLGRAVEHGRISPPVFAKMTRQLAREWYLKKALVRKIARGMGLLSV